MAIDANLLWECRAFGEPRPTYRWLKNGHPLTTQVKKSPNCNLFCMKTQNCVKTLVFNLQGRIHMEANTLTISKIALSDSGMYQCIAQNAFGSIHASAELKVVGESS